jgi:hypothetical protein
MKQVSEKQFDKMCKTLAKKYYEQTNESRRKCFFWATSDLLKRYEIRPEKNQNDLLGL